MLLLASVQLYTGGVKLDCIRMSLYSQTCKTILKFFFTIILSVEICSVPINNGFNVKFRPVSAKEDVKIKSIGGLFAKIPQVVTPVTTEELFPEAMIPRVGDLGIGCTNQIARLLFPSRQSTEFNNSRSSGKASFIKVPIMSQPLDSYKIIVATAPKHIKIGKGKNAQPFLIYIIIHDEDTNDAKSIKIPSIYFVNKVDGSTDFMRKEKVDPIFVMDSNRTVTGLKSTEVSKFIKFRNKLANHFKLTV